MKREAELKAAFGRELRRRLPKFIVLHYVTAGAPDREIVGNGVTSRWEMKHGTPAFEAPGNQTLTCMRLASQGHCRYVLWREDRHGHKETLIIHPNRIYDKSYVAEVSCEGFDFEWLVQQVKKVHGVADGIDQSAARNAARATPTATSE